MNDIIRSDVRIPARSGDGLDAWLYLPKTPGPHPAVVMAHGIGGIKAAGLAPFAEHFAGNGFAALVFDYRHCCVLNVKEWLCSNQYRIGVARMMRVLWPLGVARRWEAPSRPALR